MGGRQPLASLARSRGRTDMSFLARVLQCHHRSVQKRPARPSGHAPGRSVECWLIPLSSRSPHALEIPSVHHPYERPTSGSRKQAAPRKYGNPRFEAGAALGSKELVERLVGSRPTIGPVAEPGIGLECGHHGRRIDGSPEQSTALNERRADRDLAGACLLCLRSPGLVCSADVIWGTTFGMSSKRVSSSKTACGARRIETAW